MSERLEKKRIPALYLKKLSGKISPIRVADHLNVSDSHIYTALKESEARPTLELAAKAIYKNMYPESSDPDKKHIWMVKVPDDQTETLGKLLTALGCKFSRFIS